MTMNVDIETYSSIDIREAGVYAYASAPDFEILLIGYRYDGQDVKVIDLTDPLADPERDFPDRPEGRQPEFLSGPVRSPAGERPVRPGEVPLPPALLRRGAALSGPAAQKGGGRPEIRPQAGGGLCEDRPGSDRGIERGADSPCRRQPAPRVRRSWAGFTSAQRNEMKRGPWPATGGLGLRTP